MAHTIISVEIFRCRCQVCGHRWRTNSLALPRRCPSHACRSTLWNRSQAGAPPASRPRRPLKKIYRCAACSDQWYDVPAGQPYPRTCPRGHQLPDPTGG
jgi:predicted Zn-ribbon and HTH transcriptional regulator